MKITLPLLNFIFRHEEKLSDDYDVESRYKDKSYFEICSRIGYPVISEKEGNGIKCVWLLNDRRLALSFDDNMVFQAVISFTRLPKTGKVS